MGNKMVRSAMSVALAASMIVTSAVPALGAQTNPDASAEREAKNAAISQYAATQGMVLLDNSQKALPIAKSGNIALYGTGTYATVRGGTGSGAVNVKAGGTINVYRGFKNAGYNIVNEEYVAGLETQYGNTTNRDEGLYNEEEVKAAAAASDTAIYVISRNSGEFRDRSAVTGDYYLRDSEADNLAMLGKNFKNVIVVINAGGIMDTNFYHGLGKHEAGDELNRDKIEGLDALVLMSQAGMNGGPALVEVLNGTQNPSGKLTDTWAIEYTDYPSSDTFTNRDNITYEEIYTEDIYVGYRYFDTFGKNVAYEFGFGGSYTDFTIDVRSVVADEDTVTVRANVTNTGTAAGKEVVEVYFSAPEGSVDKPFQELAGFQKVEVAPGETENVKITFDTKDMSSYDEAKEAYVLEDGNYTIRVGNSSRNTVVAGTLALDEDVITEYCKNQLGLTKDGMQAGEYEDGALLHLTDNNDRNNPAYGTDPVEGMLDEKSEGYGTGITPGSTGLHVAAPASVRLEKANFPEAQTHEYTGGVINTYVSSNANKDSGQYAINRRSTETEALVTVPAAEGATLVDVADGKITMEQLVADMSNVELADLVEGGSYAGLTDTNDETGAVIGSAAQSVQGAAGETTNRLYTTRLIPNIVLSDGPAGIRITNNYTRYTLVSADAVFDANAAYYTSSGGNRPTYTRVEFANESEFRAALNGETALYTGITYYQYCTAIPIGTLLAQTWDPEVIEMAGRVIGEEMLEYGVTSWLAPGMNIHRNPLCGRNFEYYSEDPLIVGMTATAETKGVQTDENGKYTGIGVTLKHFAFNQQEAARNGSNSVMSERAAREIYLKGFEIGVKEANPDYIMTSYNMVNGCPTFHSYPLLTEILRNEWGFNGFVMTDWGATNTLFGKHATYVTNPDTGAVSIDSTTTRINSRGWLMYAGNDLEMPGSNVPNMISALRDGSIMRLGDLQRSAINMLKVIQRSRVFNQMYALLKESGNQTAEDKLAQAASQAAERAAEAAASASQAAANAAAAAAASQAAAENQAAMVEISGQASAAAAAAEEAAAAAQEAATQAAASLENQETMAQMASQAADAAQTAADAAEAALELVRSQDSLANTAAEAAQAAQAATQAIAEAAQTQTTAAMAAAQSAQAAAQQAADDAVAKLNEAVTTGNTIIQNAVNAAKQVTDAAAEAIREQNSQALTQAANAQAQATQAVAAAQQAVADFTSEADTIKGQVADAASKADNAIALAQAAQAAADEAQKKANAAQAAADGAQKKAEEAQKAAEENARKLAEAEKKLEEAKKAAEEAKAQAGANDTLAKEAMAQVQAAKKELEALQFKAQDIGLKKATGKKKAIKVSWTKVSGADGYEISYATKAGFAKAAKKSVSKSSITVKGLKARKKYYVRVRAYKTIGGKKVYTGYSDKLSVKTK